MYCTIVSLELSVFRGVFEMEERQLGYCFFGNHSNEMTNDFSTNNFQSPDFVFHPATKNVKINHSL